MATAFAGGILIALADCAPVPEALNPGSTAKAKQVGGALATPSNNQVTDATAAPQFGQAPPTEKENAWESGCPSSDIRGCLGQLAHSFAISAAELEQKTGDLNQVDVNGKRIGKDTVDFDGSTPENGKFAMIEIHLAPGEISRVDAFVNVPWDLSIAHTAEEYDKTGLYYVFKGILGSECPSLNKLTVYKFLENVVKPNISAPRETTSYDLGISIGISQHTPELPFCGKKFSYNYSIGSDTDAVTLDNPHGVSSITTISFAR